MRKLLVLVLLMIAFSNLYSQEIKAVKNVDDLKEIQTSTKGKIVLYNFWATWCKPCVVEFPELVKLYKNYKDSNFVLVFVSMDMPEDMKEKVKPFLEKHGVDFVTYYNDFKNPEAIIEFYDKNWEGAIPSTYIYDKEGKLSTKFVGNRDYEFFKKEISKLLN
ncbi:MAG: TlpA family protein disulfide reductase [Ignavibacteria bacterium]